MSQRLFASLVLAVPVAVALSLAGCGGGKNPSGQADGPTITDAASTTTTAMLPGDPAPEELQGTWLLRSDDPGPVRLYLYEDRYAISAGGSAQGDIVVNGNEIAFFNSNAPSCIALRLPEGVGRYRWRITGDTLRLAPVGKDPCGGRRPVLAGATYVRVG